MDDDVLLLNNNFIVLVVYLVLRLEISKSTSLFDIELIGLEVSNLAQLIINNDSQPYEGY